MLQCCYEAPLALNPALLCILAYLQSSFTPTLLLTAYVNNLPCRIILKFPLSHPNFQRSLFPHTCVQEGTFSQHVLGFPPWLTQSFGKLEKNHWVGSVQISFPLGMCYLQGAWDLPGPPGALPWRCEQGEDDVKAHCGVLPNSGVSLSTFDT